MLRRVIGQQQVTINPSDALRTEKLAPLFTRYRRQIRRFRRRALSLSPSLGRATGALNNKLEPYQGQPNINAKTLRPRFYIWQFIFLLTIVIGYHRLSGSFVGSTTIFFPPPPPTFHSASLRTPLTASPLSRARESLPAFYGISRQKIVKFTPKNLSGFPRPRPNDTRDFRRSRVNRPFSRRRFTRPLRARGSEEPSFSPKNTRVTSFGRKSPL